MKKILRKVSEIYLWVVFSTCPALIMILYFTYTEKLVVPIIFILTLIASYLVYSSEEW